MQGKFYENWSKHKNIRISQCKTQKEVAELGGFRQGIYANWENDRYLPGAESLIKLADCFGCSVDYLLGRGCENCIKPFSKECKPITEENFAIEKFPEILKELRNERKLTQQELAQRSGISISDINTWELGESLPLPDGLIVLSRALGCTVDKLLGGSSAKEFVTQNQMQLSDTEMDLIKNFSTITERQQQALVALIYEITDKK